MVAIVVVDVLEADVVDVVAVAVAVVVIRLRIRILIHIRIHIHIRFRIRIGIRIRIRVRIRTQMTGRAWCCACTKPAKGVPVRATALSIRFLFVLI